MVQKTTNYNLLYEDWIPVLYHTGTWKRVGILEAFKEADQIRQIAASNPMDLFAIHRFLLTLLYWKAVLVGGVNQVRKSLLDDFVPKALCDAIMEESDNFNLFDTDRPFMQDLSLKLLKADKSPGSLFAEFATGTNIAHFHHGDDGNAQLCLRCATLGMVRIVPWSQQGGQGLSAAIHKAPPVMALAIGSSLAETLGLNFIPMDIPIGNAHWSGSYKPPSDSVTLPIMEGFTWSTRRIHLGNLVNIDTCWYCGTRDTLGFGKIVYEKNDFTKSKSPKWKDPAAFYDEKKSSIKAITSGNEKGAVRGRDLENLVGKEGLKFSLVVRTSPNHQGWILIIPTTPGNAKTFDHRSIETESLTPPALQGIIKNTQEAHVKYTIPNLKGWDIPEGYPMRGESRFIRSALNFLNEADWMVLSNAAFKRMDEALAAFDLFAGIYWALKKPKPYRNAAWLTLKLMASVPNRLRESSTRGGYTPLRDLQKRQLSRESNNQGVKLVQYPLALPRGERLEAALKRSLARHTAKKNSEPIDWAGLCHALDQLLNYS